MADLGSTRIYGDLVVTGEIKTHSSGGSGGGGAVEPVGYDTKRLSGGASHTFTPPSGTRIMIKELYAFSLKEYVGRATRASHNCRLKRNGVLFLDEKGDGSHPTTVVGVRNDPLHNNTHMPLRIGVGYMDGGYNSTDLYVPSTFNAFFLDIDETLTIETNSDDSYAGIFVLVNYIK